MNTKADDPHTPGPIRETVGWLLHERNGLEFAVEAINTDAGQAHHWLLPHPGHTLLHGARGFGIRQPRPRAGPREVRGGLPRTGMTTHGLPEATRHGRDGDGGGEPTTMRDARDDWRRFDAATIPSKASTPHLDRFLAAVLATAAATEPLTLLDVGCGTGRHTRRLYDQGFSVLGVDVNPAAIRAAQALAMPADALGRSLRFTEGDFAADGSPGVEAGPFDVVVCQLVLSIIGNARQRANLLRHAREHLRSGAWFALSASGVSDTINAGYARLYAEDLPLTGERHSYLSRNDRGEVLYTTHHFTPDELVQLLAAAGFDRIHVTTEKETSSRRPDEAAYFHYATCRAST